MVLGGPTNSSFNQSSNNHITDNPSLFCCSANGRLALGLAYDGLFRGKPGPGHFPLMPDPSRGVKHPNDLGASTNHPRIHTLGRRFSLSAMTETSSMTPELHNSNQIKDWCHAVNCPREAFGSRKYELIVHEYVDDSCIKCLSWFSCSCRIILPRSKGLPVLSCRKV